MDLLQKFQQHIASAHLFQKTDKLLVAVSGGIDSIVLCELCKQSNYNFSIAHCNFGLRGAESERDEAFVKTITEKYDSALFLERFDTTTTSLQQKLSIQEAARTLRYEWFAAVQKKHQFDAVLLAHHADDNIETVLMHFFRGTGLQGLTGMPQVKENIFIRPLLPFKRSEIESFANEQGLQWVEDSSNASNKYTRNFFRNELLPQIRKVFPQAEENILNNIRRFQQINALYQKGYETLKRSICETEGTTIRMPVLKLQQVMHTSFLFETVQAFGFGEKQLPDIQSLFTAQNGKYVANENWQIIRHNRWLIVAPQKKENEIFVLEEWNSQLHFNGHKMEVTRYAKAKWKLDTSPMTAQVDAKNITFPLVLRKWKSGDYFYPLGMHKKKKLARFFIDQKLSKDKKENVWVLESNKKIVWIVGYRIDDRFKVLDRTKEVLEFRYSA